MEGRASAARPTMMMLERGEGEGRRRRGGGARDRARPIRHPIRPPTPRAPAACPPPPHSRVAIAGSTHAGRVVGSTVVSGWESVGIAPQSTPLPTPPTHAKVDEMADGLTPRAPPMDALTAARAARTGMVGARVFRAERERGRVFFLNVFFPRPQPRLLSLSLSLSLSLCRSVTGVVRVCACVLWLSTPPTAPPACPPPALRGQSGWPAPPSTGSTPCPRAGTPAPRARRAGWRMSQT